MRTKTTKIVPIHNKEIHELANDLRECSETIYKTLEQIDFMAAIVIEISDRLFQISHKTKTTKKTAKTK